MDNTNPNKSVELLNGLGALMVLQVCKKVKVSYLTVGHTHNDNDGEIGTSSSDMTNKVIQTIDVFDELCRQSFENSQRSTTINHKIIGITDWGKLFSTGKKNPFDINGL